MSDKTRVFSFIKYCKAALQNHCTNLPAMYGGSVFLTSSPNTWSHLIYFSKLKNFLSHIVVIYIILVITGVVFKHIVFVGCLGFLFFVLVYFLFVFSYLVYSSSLKKYYHYLLLVVALGFTIFIFT